MCLYLYDSLEVFALHDPEIRVIEWCNELESAQLLYQLRGWYKSLHV